MTATALATSYQPSNHFRHFSSREAPARQIGQQPPPFDRRGEPTQPRRPRLGQRLRHLTTIGPLAPLGGDGAIDQ